MKSTIQKHLIRLKQSSLFEIKGINIIVNENRKYRRF